MTMIKDGAYKFWQSRQPKLLPLAAMRDIEERMLERRVKNILEIGLDLTVLSVLAYAKETGAEVSVVLPRKSALVKEVKRVSDQLGLDFSRALESAASQDLWPSVVPTELKCGKYDCVRLMGYGDAQPDHRKQVIDEIAPFIAQDALIFVYPCAPSDESQLVSDLAKHTSSFDVERRGSVACVQISSAMSSPVEAPEYGDRVSHVVVDEIADVSATQEDAGEDVQADSVVDDSPVEIDPEGHDVVVDVDEEPAVADADPEESQLPSDGDDDPPRSFRPFD